MSSKPIKWKTVEYKTKNVQKPFITQLDKQDKKKIHNPTQNKQYIESKDKLQNYKKLLCNNIVDNKECCYGSKCSYAHTLDEQNIDWYRKNAYDILKSDTQLDNINLKINKNLYKTLLGLTQLCPNCDEQKCTGGYNCKFGACHKKYEICFQDLNYGNCNDSCQLVHLTRRGLVPYSNYNTYNIEHQGKVLSQDYFNDPKLNMIMNTNLQLHFQQEEYDELSSMSDNSTVSPTVDLSNKSIFEDY
jgi:hypothetical protein